VPRRQRGEGRHAKARRNQSDRECSRTPAIVVAGSYHPPIVICRNDGARGYHEGIDVRCRESGSVFETGSSLRQFRRKRRGVCLASNMSTMRLPRTKHVAKTNQSNRSRRNGSSVDTRSRANASGRRAAGVGCAETAAPCPAASSSGITNSSMTRPRRALAPRPRLLPAATSIAE
jgi:hypothetical protein